MTDVAFWDVTIGWTPGPGEVGGWSEASGHIMVEYAATAEDAIRVLREWRKVDRPAEMISVRRYANGRWVP